MILAIDVGNTSSQFAIFEGQRILCMWRIQTKSDLTADILVKNIHDQDIPIERLSGGILGSVVPAKNDILKQFFNDHVQKKLLIVGEEGIEPGIDLEVETPKQIGADRIANVVAANYYYHAPIIVIDFGTATTFDVISKKGSYQGGVIAPGIRMSLKALHQETAKLPKIDLRVPDQVIGKNTDTAMQSGIFWGYMSLIEGMLKRIENELGQVANTVATGGDAELFEKHTNSIKSLKKDLTMQGLRMIYERNCH